MKILRYEIGGTVGDIESLPFFDNTQIRNDKNISSALIHMTYVPYLSSAGELKQKLLNIQLENFSMPVFNQMLLCVICVTNRQGLNF